VLVQLARPISLFQILILPALINFVKLNTAKLVQIILPAASATRPTSFLVKLAFALLLTVKLVLKLHLKFVQNVLLDTSLIKTKIVFSFA